MLLSRKDGKLCSLLKENLSWKIFSYCTKIPNLHFSKRRGTDYVLHFQFILETFMALRFIWAFFKNARPLTLTWVVVLQKYCCMF